jgi:hypothetical protein
MYGVEMIYLHLYWGLFTSIPAADLSRAKCSLGFFHRLYTEHNQAPHDTRRGHELSSKPVWALVNNPTMDVTY